MWSLGCVVAELCLSIEKNNYVSLQKNVLDFYLFPGASCFPLSPCQDATKLEDEDTNCVSSEDQIFKVFELLGKQDDTSFGFIDDESVLSYVKNV